jgi:hypothetical protein
MLEKVNFIMADTTWQAVHSQSAKLCAEEDCNRVLNNLQEE